MSFAIHCFTSGHRTPPLTLTRNSLRAPGEEAASQASCPKLTLSQDLDFSRALFPCNKSADDRVTFSAKKNGNLSFRPGQPLSEASALPGAVDILALYLCMTLSWHNTHTLTHRDTLTPDRSSPRRARAHTHFFSAKGFRGPLFFVGWNSNQTAIPVQHPTGPIRRDLQLVALPPSPAIILTHFSTERDRTLGGLFNLFLANRPKNLVCKLFSSSRIQTMPREDGCLLEVGSKRRINLL